jgi:cytochrome P450
MDALLHNKNEWIEPERYIPERFDKDSQYFLTPSGNKRHPLSFTPFLGGKRVCMGKSFAELVSKVLIPGIFMKYEFEIEDKNIYENKPLFSLESEIEP